MENEIRMESEDIAYRRQVVEMYKPDVERLIRYLPWREQCGGDF